jgi:hypothetical protein
VHCVGVSHCPWARRATVKRYGFQLVYEPRVGACCAGLTFVDTEVNKTPIEIAGRDKIRSDHFWRMDRSGTRSERRPCVHYRVDFDATLAWLMSLNGACFPGRA